MIESQGPDYIEGPVEAVENCGLRWAMRVTRLPDGDGVGFRPWDPLQFRFRGRRGDHSPTRCASLADATVRLVDGSSFIQSWVMLGLAT